MKYNAGCIRKIFALHPAHDSRLLVLIVSRPSSIEPIKNPAAFFWRTDLGFTRNRH
jgi:hypothetical protein